MNNLLFINLKKEKVCLFITIPIIISVLLFISFYQYEKLVSCYGKYDNKNILVMIEKKDISNISNKLYINNSLRECKIAKISKEYSISSDYKMYYEVYYECNINSNDLIDSYIFNIKISKGKTTLLKKILRKE